MNILIVRQQNNQLGDLICTIPMFMSLRKKFPDSEITLLAGKTNYPIPYMDLCPEITRVITLEKETPIKYYKFIKNLRSLNIELGIVPATLKISRTSHILNFLSGAKLRVGVKSIDDDKNKFSFLLNVKKDFHWNTKKVHQTIRSLEVVEQIGCENTADIRNIKMKFKNNLSEKADELIRESFSSPEALLIGLHPGAGKTANIWNTENFYILAKRLYEKYKCNFIITSGNIDDKTTGTIRHYFDEEKFPYIILDNLEINYLGAIMSKMNLYITNDTGVMHLANYAGTKVLSLFGLTKGYEWAPLSSHSRYIQSKSDNINDIPPNEVFDYAIKLLNE
jgi:heptosyltransferase-2